MKIFISGDFAPRLRVNEVIASGNYELLYNDMLPIINEADFAITNLESPLIETGTPIKKTGPNLKSPMKSIEALKYAGFDMVTLANNHLMDYGKDGLVSTINACETSGIHFVGAGMNHDEASQIKYEEIGGKIVSFINCCENEWSTTHGEEPGCNPLDEIGAFYQIQEAKRNSDYTILIIHGGHEMYEYPSPRMKKLYRWFVDLGVDAVIGHHTHCYCGWETYKNKPIVYSLGNFIFDHPTWRDGAWTKACAAILIIQNNGISIKMIPYHQCDHRVGVNIYDESELEQFELQNMAKQSIIDDDEKLQHEFEKHISKVKRGIINMFEPSYDKYYQYALAKGLLPHFITESHLRVILNNVRCESHHDLLIEVLKNDIR